MSRGTAELVTHADCLGCDYRGQNVGDGHLCNLWGGIKRPETPCPDPEWRDVMAKAESLREGKFGKPV